MSGEHITFTISFVMALGYDIFGSTKVSNLIKVGDRAVVSIRDLVGRGGVDRSAQEEALGNVHLRVSDYVRNDQEMATGVIGKDLKTGKELTISLARGDTFAKLYTNPNMEWSERQQIAASTTANRAELSEFGVKKKRAETCSGRRCDCPDECAAGFRVRKAVCPLGQWHGS